MSALSIRKYQQGGPAQSPAQDQGLDLEGQLKQGVEAFMQSQDPAIAIEVVNMLAQMMGVAPEIDQYQDNEAAENQPPGSYPNEQPQVSEQQVQPQGQQVPMGRNGMRIYKVGGKIDPTKKKAQPAQPLQNTTSTLQIPPALLNYDSIPIPDLDGVINGSAARILRGSDNTLKRIQKPDYAGISNQTMSLDRKTAAGTGNGFFDGSVAPSLGGVGPDNLLGVGGPRTGKKIVYVKRKGS